MNLSDSVIIWLKKKETYYIKETSLLSLLSVKEMRQLLFYKIYEDIINSSHYLCYFFIRWVLWSFLLIRWVNTYLWKNNLLKLIYLSYMNFPYRECQVFLDRNPWFYNLLNKDLLIIYLLLLSLLFWSFRGVSKMSYGQSYFI